MRALAQSVTAIILFLACVSANFAQDSKEAQATPPALAITAFASSERVRFTAPASVVQMRLEVYDAAGRKLFDNELRGGNVLDWHLQDGQAARLQSDTYLCVVTVKSRSGRITQKLGSVLVEQNGASVQVGTATPLTAQQAATIGPLEENAFLSVVKEDETQTATVIAHNGEEGQLVRGRGALSFRLGDLFSGKDREQMRLTSDGKLGLGIAEPQTKLDVAGPIRTSEGIVFPDGTVQTTAYVASGRSLSERSRVQRDAQGRSLAEQDKSDRAQQEARLAPEGTFNRLAKFANDGVSLVDSGIIDVGGNVGIGVANPQSNLDYRGSLAPFFTRDIGTTNFGTAQSALQLGVTNTGSRNVNVGPSFLFFGDNTAGAKSFLGRVSGVWENPTAGAEAGAILFQVRGGSGDTGASTERMRITAAGNVGIGTSAPTAKLHLAVGGGKEIALGVPNGEVGMSLVAAGGSRADLRYNGSLLQLVNGLSGAPPATNGITINTTGNVGIGTSNPPIAKLHVLTVDTGLPAIYAESLNRGVWGKSTGSSYGVYGESGSGIGMQGVSTSNIGVGGISNSHYAVAGTSTSSIGVRGETASTSIASPGVRGISTGAGGVGVRGDGTTGVYGVSSNGVGVTGEANASGSTGVYGTSTSGYAVYANGNAGQARDKGGFVKAMIYVDPFLSADQYIVRCYNGITNSSTGNCGFSVVRNDVGQYSINFGFQIDDRFFSLTTNTPINTYGVSVSGVTTVDVEIWQSFNNPASHVDTAFWLIVF